MTLPVPESPSHRPGWSEAARGSGAHTAGRAPADESLPGAPALPVGRGFAVQSADVGFKRSL